MYSPTYGDDSSPYEILNDTTVKIEEELWKIRKLASNELYLHNEVINTVDNEKYVQRLYFVR
jgi:hypothetical protein